VGWGARLGGWGRKIEGWMSENLEEKKKEIIISFLQ
jgi:hypothetical protein